MKIIKFYQCNYVKGCSLPSLEQNKGQNQSNCSKYFIQCTQSEQTNEYFRSLFITTPCTTFH